MIAEKLKAIIDSLDKPKREINELRFAAAIAELAALINEADELPGEVFELLPLDARKGAMQIVLGIFMQTLQ